MCHEAPATQAANAFKPSRVACGSCHDNINFATGLNHVDLPQVSDNGCANCHIKQGEFDFDASIMGAHAIPTQSRMLPGTTFEIVQVADVAPGKKPTIVFTIKDKNGAAIPASQQAMSLALPDEPIGKGGKWQVLTRSPDSGLDLIQEVVEKEAQRQINLIAIRDELLARHAAVHDEITDVTGLFNASESKVIKKALSSGGVIYAVRLDGFKGLKMIGYHDFCSFECGVSGDRAVEIPKSMAFLREQWEKA